MFSTPSNLTRLETCGLFSQADLYQARYAASLAAPDSQALVAGLTALVSLAVREGHVCLDLRDAAIQERLRLLGLPERADTMLVPGIIDEANSDAPLIINGGRLYFSRCFEDERVVARTVLALCAAAPTPAARLARLPVDAFRGDGPDWQQVAAFAALRGRFCVISGGPGTGKTRTVARILALAAELHRDEPFTIRLAAPTGKAAGRMTESLTGAFGGTLPEAVARCLRTEAQTVHRLLGWRPDGYAHHVGNPLALDMLVVDEASMLDLNMTRRLLDALPPHARLILLGDRNQLASVEAGAVLANLCLTQAVNAFSPAFAADLQRCGGPSLPLAACPSTLVDHVVELRHSYRFASDSGIAALGTAIRGGMTEAAGAILAAGHPDLKVRPCPDPQRLHKELQRLGTERFTLLGQTTDPAPAFAALDSLRLLAPLRHGPRGVEGVNRMLQEILTGSSRELWYPGRPVMVRENDSATGLYNGDVGIALPVDKTLRVFFPTPEGYISFSPARLPRTETCYCMTVHKSQGSEFDHAVLILPEDFVPTLGRELVYTALTRARQRFSLLGDVRHFLAATSQPIIRDSGLAERLQG